MQSTTLQLSAQIEGLLFFKAEPMSISELAKTLKESSEKIEEALVELGSVLSGRGLALMRANDKVSLATAAELSDLLTELRKEELEKELTKASIETVSIILYKNGATRAEIDYIRGVNSSFILRNLLVRGLVEKVTDAHDSRRYIYRPTFDLLSHLGISRVEDAPEFANIQSKLKGEIKVGDTDVSE